MSKRKDYTGMKFGELTVIGKHPKSDEKYNDRTYYDCICSCGQKVIRASSKLKDSKGCHICAYRKYGMDISTNQYRLYSIWLSMRMRCKSKSNISFKNYGGRGITVCEEWEDFNKFREWAYDNGYSDNASRKECTLDRIDVEKGYSPENCRWTNSGVQALNKRRVQNKSGARGVWLKKTGKYQAVISVNNKRVCLGTFDNIEDAISARHKAEMKYFGVVMEA